MERERNQKENWYGEIEEKAPVWRGRDRVERKKSENGYGEIEEREKEIRNRRERERNR